jgi:O-acetylserine/cysteine efflux transporter
MSARDRMLALIVVVLWGLNFLAIHAGLEHFPPLFFAALRFAVMAIPVILFIPRPKIPLRWFLLYGIGFGTVQFAFLFLAMDQGMPTGLASLVLQSSAPFTVVLCVLLLGEKMTARQVIGISVAVSGMVVIGIDRAAHGASAAVFPVILTLIAGLGWAFGNIGSRLARPNNALHMALWMSVIPPIPLYALSLAVEGPSAGFDSLTTLGSHTGLVALGGLAYVVILGTVAGAGLWAYLMSRYPASRVAPFSLLVPIVGITAAWAILGETPTGWELFGGAVVIIGCFAGVTGRSAKQAPTTASGKDTAPTDEAVPVP